MQEKIIIKILLIQSKKVSKRKFAYAAQKKYPTMYGI
jgi:hypothetical protein